MISKIQFLRQKILNNNLDGMIITNKDSIYYFTGIDTKGILLITKEDNIFLTYERYVMHANDCVTIDKQIIVKPVEKIFDYSEFFGENAIVGVEEKNITLKEYTDYQRIFKCKLKPFGNVIIDMRIIKDEEEIEYIKDVSKKLDEIYSEILKILKHGISEKEVYSHLEKLLSIKNLEFYDYPRISFGKNTSKQYLRPTYTKLKKDDIVILSLVVKDKKTKYLASIGRTIFIGNILEKIPKIKTQYLKLYNLHDKMLMMIKNNVEILESEKKVYFELERINWNINYASFRSIGLSDDEFDFEYITVGKKFKENMTLIIEPTVYIDEEYGLLIQDTTQITQTNHILLTKSNREIEE